MFLLTWREKAELARACLVLNAALEGVPTDERILAGPELSADLLEFLEARQSSDTSDVTSPLLFLFLAQTVGRTAGPVLNGWRRALAGERGSVIVVHASEAASFCADAPDLASFVLGQRVEADRLLALWSTETADVLQRWLATGRLVLPRALAALPGGEIDLDELRGWLTHHLNVTRTDG